MRCGVREESGLERARTVAEDVIVIGGGVVGASAAYALARRGARVTLVDRGDAGQATAAGAGILSAGTSIRPLPAFFTVLSFPSAYGGASPTHWIELRLLLGIRAAIAKCVNVAS